MVCLRCLVHVTSADAAFNSRWCLFFNCLDYYINNNINTNGVLRWNSVDCPWILWVFYWFKILISITAIEFAINTHSMEFLGHTPWNSVDSCGQELRIPWTDSMELPPKVGTVTESIRNPYGIKAEHESTRGSPGSVPAGISTPKTHTWIRAGMFPRVTWIRGSITCGFAGTCHSTGRNRYLQVYPQVNIFFTV